MAVNHKKDAPVDEAEETRGLLQAPEPGTEFFEGDVKTLKVTKDVNPGQLLTEIDEKLGDAEQYHVVGQFEDGEISEGNPLTLYVHGGADMRTVRGVVESHERDDHFGATPEQVEIEALKERLKAGEDLSAAELNQVLRAML